MPLYEYDCPKCGQFEAIQSFSEKPLKARPDCPEKNCPKKAERLISAAAFHLKGTGWYKTDYASDKNGSTGKTGGASKKASSEPESKPESSSGSSSTENSAAKDSKASDTKVKSTESGNTSSAKPE